MDFDSVHKICLPIPKERIMFKLISQTDPLMIDTGIKKKRLVDRISEITDEFLADISSIEK